MIKITKAKIIDAPLIRKLETDVWGEEVTNKYDMPMFIRFGWCFIAKEGKKIIGAICSYQTNGNEVFVCDLVVNKDYRQQDIGTRLYQKLIKATENKDIISFVNPKNKISLAIHQKLGFKTIKSVRNAYGSAGVLERGTRILVRLKK